MSHYIVIQQNSTPVLSKAKKSYLWSQMILDHISIHRNYLRKYARYNSLVLTSWLLSTNLFNQGFVKIIYFTNTKVLPHLCQALFFSLEVYMKTQKDSWSLSNVWKEIDCALHNNAVSQKSRRRLSPVEMLVFIISKHTPSAFCLLLVSGKKITDRIKPLYRKYISFMGGERWYLENLCFYGSKAG